MDSDEIPVKPADETYDDLAARLDWRWLRVTVYVLFTIIAILYIYTFIVPHL